MAGCLHCGSTLRPSVPAKVGISPLSEGGERVAKNLLSGLSVETFRQCRPDVGLDNVIRCTSSGSIFQGTVSHAGNHIVRAQSRKGAFLSESAHSVCIELAVGWSQRGPTRKQRRIVAVRAKDVDSDDDDPIPKKSFWEGEEGKKKLREIEEMRELMNEANLIEEEMLKEMEEQEGEGGTDGKSPEELAQERVDRLREELARKAMAQVERRKQAEAMFQLGQRAYARGVYDKSVEILEAALGNIGRNSNLGGEIQIWLAMAYDAHNRHADCIALYRALEAGHPIPAIRRQAADLRYITEAPKLKISKEEMVSIPLLDRDNVSTTRTWSQMVQERRRRPAKPTGPKERDYMEDLMTWKPPRWERSPYFWVALSVWLTAVGISLVFQ